LFQRFRGALGARNGRACSDQHCCARRAAKSVKEFFLIFWIRFFSRASRLLALLARRCALARDDSLRD
jgi:hypothetical protein